MKRGFRIAAAGLLGGFVGNGILGGLFSSPPVQALLYSPTLQSQLFRDVTPTRNIPVSVAGLVILSIVHSWLFATLQSAIPGKTAVRKGLFWGLVIWMMYWLFQEWFIYRTLLQEPLPLCLLELAILLLGSLAEGVIIALMLSRERTA